MRVKKTVKKIIDIAMLLMLPVLAVQIQLGQESHEWLVRGMVCAKANAFALALAVLGAYAFVDLKTFDYLFLQTHFMFFDESKSLVLYFAEIICMMAFWGIIGHLAICLLKNLR